MVFAGEAQKLRYFDKKPTYLIKPALKPAKGVLEGAPPTAPTLSARTPHELLPLARDSAGEGAPREGAALGKGATVLVNLSGRGDKDVRQIAALEGKLL